MEGVTNKTYTVPRGRKLGRLARVCDAAHKVPNPQEICGAGNGVLGGIEALGALAGVGTYMQVLGVRSYMPTLKGIWRLWR